MDRKNKCSPLYDIRRSLKLLRWLLGFPLQIQNDLYTEFRFVTWIEFIRYVVLLIFFFLSHEYIAIVQLIYDGNLDSFFSLYKKVYDNYSTSVLDVWSAILWIFIEALKSFAYLVCYKYHIESINQCCNGIGKVTSDAVNYMNKNIEHRRIKMRKRIENSTKSMICGLLLCAITTIMSGILMRISVEESYDKILYNYNQSIFTFITIPYMFQWFVLLYGPISCATELVITHLINRLTTLFEDWIIIMEFEDAHQANSKVEALYHDKK